jgi:glycosyltransferase involved in cell wall biosynthesis
MRWVDLKMSKNLWYVTKYFALETADSPGGRGWFLMRELVKLGYKPLVITSDSNNLIEAPVLDRKIVIEERSGVEIVWLRTFKYRVAQSLRRIFSWFHFEWNLFFLDKNRLPPPDVVVISSLSLLTIINGFLLRKKFGCRLVFEVRDIWPLTITEEGNFSRNNPLVLLLSLIEKAAYRYSDAIIGTMPNLVQHVRAVSGSEKPVYCIPMGVSESHMVRQESLPVGYKEKYLSSSKIKVVHAGTIGTTNALEVFFEAASVLSDNEFIEFIVVGDGALKDKYVEKYSCLGNIIFAPKVSRDQVQSVLAECDIVYFSVFPSKVWDYGQSLNKVIDYMLSGKPIVASYSGYTSMINEANCGSFVPSGDVLALTMELERYAAMSEAERLEIGLRGRDWIIDQRPYGKLARAFSDIVSGEL